MSDNDERQWNWQLWKNDEIIGYLRYKDWDWPWEIYSFEPTTEYEIYRPVIEEWSALEGETSDEDAAAFFEKRIATLNLRLVSPMGEILTQDDFLLNIIDSEAGLRR